MNLLYLVLVLMTMIGSVASFFLKQASGSDNIMILLKKPSLYIGGFLYFVSAVINVILLRYLDYSLVLPMTALTYVWTMIISYAFFKEKITHRKIAGVCMILLGVVAISL